MNILYLTNHLNIGGITSYVLTLGAGMKKRGHRVWVGSGGGQALRKFFSQGIEFLPLPIHTKQEVGPSVWMTAIKLADFISSERIDIVHSNSRTTQVAASLATNWSVAAHVSTAHGFFTPRFFRRLLPCWGERTIAISEQVKDHLIRDFHCAEKRITVINNGVDVEKFNIQTPEIGNEIKKSLGLGLGLIIGIVARLSDVKGHSFLLRAMKGIVADIPTAELLIVGEGKMKEQLEKLAEELGIAMKVTLLPEVEDTMKVLPAIDVFVMPSLAEGLGLALMEAMSCGKAIVASDVGGIKSLIFHEQNGLLVPPAHTAQLASAITQLLKDNEARQRYGAAARALIVARFSQEQMVTKTEEVYRQCCSKNR